MKKTTLTAAQESELKALAALPEEQINTDDVPEVTDWSGGKRGLFYRPVKKQITLRLDADLIDWFKKSFFLMSTSVGTLFPFSLGRTY